MTPDIFAEWMRRQGHRVIRTHSTYWHSQGLGAYQAFPYHWLIEPCDQELSDFISETRLLAFRYSTPPSSSLGRVSYHVVYDKPRYDFDQISQWARKNVRRGLRSCCVEPISFERLGREGFALHADTLQRQRRRVTSSQDWWSRRCMAAVDLTGFEAWGALVGGRLAATLTAFRVQDCFYLLDQQCRTEYLPARVNNALTFVVTRELRRRPGVQSILYAVHSLDAPPRVDEFKFRMGYEPKPVRQRVVLHPLLEPLTNRAGHALLRFAVRLRPGDATLSKAEGMLRFYLEGRLPAERQVAPRGLQGVTPQAAQSPEGC